MTLSRDRFAALAAAFGADIDRWPPHERAAAHALLRAYPDVEAWLAPERKLDQMMAAWHVAPPPPFLGAAMAGGLTTGIMLAIDTATPRMASPSFYEATVLGAPFNLESGDSTAGAGTPPGAL
jgi:hypothetical protein